jgi:hypothetical protein
MLPWTELDGRLTSEIELQGFYNLGMASTKTPAQIEANYVRLMGPQAKVKPVPRSSREQIKKAIAAIDDALHFVDHHYTGHEAPIYDHLDIQGGAGAILWIVRRGLRARDDDFTVRRPPMRFTD